MININLKKILKTVCLTLAIMVPISIMPLLVVHAEDIIPTMAAKEYTFTDEADLKWQIVNDPAFIGNYATLANTLGYGWCGGDYVGQNFAVSQSGSDYVLQAMKGNNSGYRDNDRLKMTVSNVKFFIDPTTIVKETPKISDVEASSASYTNIFNNGRTAIKGGAEAMVARTGTMSNTINESFTNTIGLKETVTATVGVPAVASGSVALETSMSFSQESGWTSTTTNSTTDQQKYNISNVLIPANSHVPINITTDKCKATVAYTAKVYADYNITFDGFMRYEGNNDASHPTDRPSKSYTFGAVGGKSAVEDIKDQYAHRNITGYSSWDWNGVVNDNGSDITNNLLANCLQQVGGVQSGKLVYDGARSVNLTVGASVQN